MDGPSITKNHGAKQVRKLKVSLPEIVLVEGSGSRHSYCPRRHDEDMHMHNVPVLLIRERKEVSVHTSTSSRTSHANSACHRL
mmetsp:Transcript_24065/g.36731  ORF Transcript_24065/g.36731 Transcript_24065/m.36731 type:complete len:83 (-) Transcript_24065:406-654(-)